MPGIEDGQQIRTAVSAHHIVGLVDQQRWFLGVNNTEQRRRGDRAGDDWSLGEIVDDLEGCRLTGPHRGALHCQPWRDVDAQIGPMQEMRGGGP